MSALASKAFKALIKQATPPASGPSSLETGDPIPLNLSTLNEIAAAGTNDMTLHCDSQDHESRNVKSELHPIQQRSSTQGHFMSTNSDKNFSKDSYLQIMLNHYMYEDRLKVKALKVLKSLMAQRNQIAFTQR